MLKNNIFLGVMLSLGITTMVVLSRLTQARDGGYVDDMAIHTFVMLMAIWFLQLGLLNWKLHVRRIPNSTLRSVVDVILVSALVYLVLEVLLFVLDIPFVGRHIEHTEQRAYRWSFGRVLFWNTIYLWILYSQKNIEEKKNALLELGKVKQLALEARMSSFKEQLSPHFMFNSLNTLCSMTNDESVQSFVGRLAEVYRYTLTTREHSEVRLKDELDFTLAYWYIQKERFEDAIFIEVQFVTDTRLINIPPMALQTLVENAIKHNKATESFPLKVSIKEIDGEIEVRNNIQIKHKTVESIGVGLSNLSERYKLLYDKDIIIKEENGDFIVSLPICA